MKGHPVAAVAATSNSIANKALKLIEVDYEILPHVIDVMDAIKEGAPLLHEDMITDGVEPAPTTASNVAKRVEFAIGDVEGGFKQADTVIERTFDTKPVHQAYIEPHACVASFSEDGQAELFVSTQGHFIVRTHCARLLGMDVSKLRVTAAEIGGGFGGKTVVYLEPLALVLSRKSRKPVKMQMSREEVFKASGPTSGAHMRIKIGATKDGRITAGECELYYQAGAFQGGPVGPGAMCAFAPYDLENVKAVGFDIVTNRPKVAAYRAPGAPISEYAVECVVDELAKTLGIDPIDFPLEKRGQRGHTRRLRPKVRPRRPDRYPGGREIPRPLPGPPQGQPRPWHGLGLLVQYWGRDLVYGERQRGWHGHGDPGHAGYRWVACVKRDHGRRGLRHRLRQGPPHGRRHQRARLHLPDRRLPRNALQWCCRTRSGQPSDRRNVQACRQDLGNPDEDAVKWENGHALPAGENAGQFEPISMAEIAAMAGKTGGPIAGHAHINVQGAGPSFGTHIVDVEVDKETGRVDILRYTVVQDAGKAVHPAYVEGQYQGGAVQGIGWALNEEYIYGEDGKLQNPGFLDYRIPVASDVPMIDTVIVECANPNHPYGVRGVGETPIVPPMAAIANAIEQATGIRFTELPMSPPKVLKALSDAGSKG